MLDRSDETQEHGHTTEEIDFGAYTQTAIEETEFRTGLAFPELKAVDTFQA